MNKIQSGLVAVNVSWFFEDLELYDNQYGFLESISFTVARLVTLIMAIIVHRQKYSRLRSLLPNQNFDFIFYLAGWYGSFPQSENEGCSKLSYLIAEVEKLSLP